MARKTKIFTIYAWEDKNAMLQLLRHLKPFEEDFDLSFWHDDPINTGQEWKPQDESRLNEADIFLLLVSADFMNSEFIKQLEFKNIIDRYKENKSVVIPVILEYCRWEIDFKSDDYNFNLNELQVLPNDGKPLENWSSPDLAFNNIATNIKKVINLFSDDSELLELGKKAKKTMAVANSKDQMAIDFIEESETEEKSEEENRIKAALQLKRDIEEQQRLEAIKMAEEELKIKQEAGEKSRAEEEERLLKKDENRRRVEEEEGKSAEEEKRLMEEAEAKRKAEEEIRLKEEAETKKREEEEQRFIEELEARRKAEEEERLKEAAAANHLQYADDSDGQDEETEQGKETSNNKRILAGVLVALLAIIGIWAFSNFYKGSENTDTTLPETEAIEVTDSDYSDETQVDAPKGEEDFSKLAIGGTYEGGIVFEIDNSGKTGKIAHIDDAGPMPWTSAMKIDEQLGAGWRLPNFDELRLMHKTIGQGATNDGEFTDELYWSATAYDNNQARLLRFNDGNTSYHYNSRGTHRKFLVRAIREFSW